MNAWRSQLPATRPAHIIATIFTSVPTSSITRTECLARRLLHGHERIQLDRHVVPRPSTFCVRSDQDARRLAGDIHYARHHEWIIRTDLPASGSRWLDPAASRCTSDVCAMARHGQL